MSCFQVGKKSDSQNTSIFTVLEIQMKRTHSESVFITNISDKYKCNYGVLSLLLLLYISAIKVHTAKMNFQ